MKTEMSIIIPAYNEEKRLPKCLKRTIEFCKEEFFDFEIIVAEDGSTDNTIEIVKDFQKQDKRIKLISFKKRMGKGAAITNAILTAQKKYVGFMDADMAADAYEFRRLLEKISECDVVIGSRFLRDGLEPIKRPAYRALFSNLYSNFFRILFKISIYDPQCGFKLFRREAVYKIFKEIHTTGFAFDSEVVVKAYILGLRVKEVPINWSHDAASKISVVQQLKEMSQDLLSVWYEAHMMWLQNKKVYPQKKGSRKARILFSFLSLYKKPRKSRN